MAVPKRLWSANFQTTPEAAPVLSDALGDDALSLTVMAPPRSGKAEIQAIFAAEPDITALQTRLAILCSLNGIKIPQINVRELPNLDWLKKVSEDFPPLPIGRWVVYGAQHKCAAARHRKINLQIDATSAFGTGEHPTTRGCMLMLDRVLKSAKPTRMLDVGCGSGILAMAYAKTTKGRTVGVELDPDSVLIARHNIHANGLQQDMRVTLGNGYHAALVRNNAPYDLIMANIFAGPLCRMAYQLRQNLKPGGMAILSGLLNHQANHVIAAHRMQGLILKEHMKIGEWSVLAMHRPKRAE